MSFEDRLRRAARQAKHASAPKRSFLWVGPKGTCECCDSLVDVYLCSPLGQPSDKPWVASEALLMDLYEPLVHRMQMKDDKFFVRCTGALVRDGHAKTQAKLYYFDLDGKVAGPFCLKCLKGFMRKWEREDGSQPDIRVYKVTTTHKALTKLLESGIGPVDEGPELEDEQETVRDLY